LSRLDLRQGACERPVQPINPLHHNVTLPFSPARPIASQSQVHRRHPPRHNSGQTTTLTKVRTRQRETSPESDDACRGCNGRMARPGPATGAEKERLRVGRIKANRRRLPPVSGASKQNERHYESVLMKQAGRTGLGRGGWGGSRGKRRRGGPGRTDESSAFTSTTRAHRIFSAAQTAWCNEMRSQRYTHAPHAKSTVPIQEKNFNKLNIRTNCAFE